MPAQRAFREGWSAERLQNTLARDRVDAMIAHARWAGSQLARVMLFRNAQDKTNALLELGQHKHVAHMIFLYGVQEPLMEYVLKTAARVIQDGPLRDWTGNKVS